MDDMKNFILPAQNSFFDSFGNNLTRLALRYSMINKYGDATPQDASLHRIMPLIKKDGTLCLIQRMIDKQYAGQISQLIEDVIAGRELLGKMVKCIIIDDIQIQESQLMAIFEAFHDPETKRTRLRHLTMGDVIVNQEFM